MWAVSPLKARSAPWHWGWALGSASRCPVLALGCVYTARTRTHTLIRGFGFFLCLFGVSVFAALSCLPYLLEAGGLT